MLCGRGNNGGDGFVVARTLHAARRRRVGVPDRPRRRRPRRRAHEPRDPRPPRPDRRRDRRQPGVGAALLGGQRLHADRRRDLRHRPQRAAVGPDGDGRRRRQRVGHSGRVDRPAVGPLGRFARADRRFDRGRHDRDARRAEAAAGAAARRNARRRHRHRRHRHSGGSHRGARRPAGRAADARRHARADHAALARQPQGGLRPRADRRPDRAARPARRISPRSARSAVGRRPRDRRDAGLLPADRRRDGARVHDRSRSTRRPTGSIRTRVDRVLDLARDVIAIGPGLGQAPPTREFVQAARRSRDDAARHRCRRPERVRGRSRRGCRAAKGATSSSRRIQARWRGSCGMSTDEVQASRLEIARNFATCPPRVRRAQGPSHAHRDARREGVHQSDRQLRAWRPAAPATC